MKNIKDLQAFRLALCENGAMQFTHEHIATHQGIDEFQDHLDLINPSIEARELIDDTVSELIEDIEFSASNAYSTENISELRAQVDRITHWVNTLPEWLRKIMIESEIDYSPKARIDDLRAEGFR